jgi:hypothetical protein
MTNLHFQMILSHLNILKSKYHRKSILPQCGVVATVMWSVSKLGCFIPHKRHKTGFNLPCSWLLDS